MTDFWIRQNDTLPALQVTLKDENGLAVDVSGATSLQFNMRDAATQSVKVNGSTATDVDGTNGVIEYQWGGTDTDTVGSYEGEFEITFSGGGIETFPNTTYIEIEIVEEIA